MSDHDFDHMSFDGTDWRPLEQVLSYDLADAFMWMYRSTEEDGTVVHAYKHCDTRRYLFLDADLQAYRYDGYRSHVPQDLVTAIVSVFLAPTIELERYQLAALADAVRRASSA